MHSLLHRRPCAPYSIMLEPSTMVVIPGSEREHAIKIIWRFCIQRKWGVGVYPHKGRFPRQCHQWQCRFSLMHPLLLQTQSETEEGDMALTLRNVQHQSVVEPNSIKFFRPISAEANPTFSQRTHVFLI